MLPRFEERSLCLRFPAESTPLDSKILLLLTQDFSKPSKGRLTESLIVEENPSSELLLLVSVSSCYANNLRLATASRNLEQHQEISGLRFFSPLVTRELFDPVLFTGGLLLQSGLN